MTRFRNRKLLGALVLPAALLAAGCGSSSHHPRHASTTGAIAPPKGVSPMHPDTAAAGGCPAGTSYCVTKDTAIKPVGSPYIDVNLERAILRQPAFKQVKVNCPPSHAYPVICQISGVATLKGQHKAVAVSGTATVLGVEVRTRTYAFSLEYRPA
jgi:hypothetical protein